MQAQRTTAVACLLVRLVAVVTAGGGLAGCALAGDASGSALAVRRGDRKVDVLLSVHADHELGHVHELLAHAVACENTEAQESGEGGGFHDALLQNR